MPGTAKKTPRKPRPALQVERRARWLLQELNRLRTYADRIDGVRAQFECGIVAAQQAHVRMLEMLKEQSTTIDVDRIVAEFWRTYDVAMSMDEPGVAARILERMARVFGIAAPDRLLIGSNDANAAQLAHVRVLQLTPAQRSNRERELAAKAGIIIDVPEVQIDSDMDIPGSAPMPVDDEDFVAP